MNSVLNIVVLLAAVAVAYYIGFKDGGRTFLKNLRASEETLTPNYNIEVSNPEIDFNKVRDAIEAGTRNIDVAQVRAERMSHEYERD